MLAHYRSFGIFKPIERVKNNINCISHDAHKHPKYHWKMDIINTGLIDIDNCENYALLSEKAMLWKNTIKELATHNRNMVFKKIEMAKPMKKHKKLSNRQFTRELKKKIEIKKLSEGSKGIPRLLCLVCAK